jgi:hypothetical protein
MNHQDFDYLSKLALELQEIKRKCGGDEKLLNKMMAEHLDKELTKQWNELTTNQIKLTNGYKNLSRELNKSKLSRKQLIKELIKNSKFPPPDPCIFKERGFYSY